MGCLLFINDWIQLELFIKKFTFFYPSQVEVARNYIRDFLSIYLILTKLN